MGKLDGKVALITGAGSGIGRAIAKLFAGEGAKVAVADYAPTGGQETVGIIIEAGGDSVFIQADVSKADDVKRMVGTTVEKYGRLDILCNNAGIDLGVAPTAEIAEEDWDRLMGINLKGVFLGSKYAIPVMLEQGCGVIINTASVAGLVGQGGMSVYSASKGGIVLLTKSMAMEYARHNIRINCVCPGMILTAMNESMLPVDPKARQAFERAMSPLGRIGLPGDVARAALYLACDDSSFVTGEAVVVDGGLTAGSSFLSARR